MLKLKMSLKEVKKSFVSGTIRNSWSSCWWWHSESGWRCEDTEVQRLPIHLRGRSSMQVCHVLSFTFFRSTTLQRKAMSAAVVNVRIRMVICYTIWKTMALAKFTSRLILSFPFLLQRTEARKISAHIKLSCLVCCSATFLTMNFRRRPALLRS
jgi:hypothetical protein